MGTSEPPIEEGARYKRKDGTQTVTVQTFDPKFKLKEEGESNWVRAVAYTIAGEPEDEYYVRSERDFADKFERIY